MMKRKLECIRMNEVGQILRVGHSFCRYAAKPLTETVCNEDKHCDRKWSPNTHLSITSFYGSYFNGRHGAYFFKRGKSLVSFAAIFRLVTSRGGGLRDVTSLKTAAKETRKIQDSLGFWIPFYGFRMQGTGFRTRGTGFRILCQWILDTGFQSFLIP